MRLVLRRWPPNIAKLTAEYVRAAPAVEYTQQAPKVEYVQAAPAVEYIQRAPMVEYNQLAAAQLVTVAPKTFVASAPLTIGSQPMTSTYGYGASVAPQTVI